MRVCEEESRGRSEETLVVLRAARVHAHQSREERRALSLPLACVVGFSSIHEAFAPD